MKTLQRLIYRVVSFSVDKGNSWSTSKDPISLPIQGFGKDPCDPLKRPLNTFWQLDDDFKVGDNQSKIELKLLKFLTNAGLYFQPISK